MICQKCGAENQEGSSVCNKCGEKLLDEINVNTDTETNAIEVVNEPVSMEEQNFNDGNVDNKKSRKKLKTIRVILTVFIIILGFTYLKNKNEVKEKQYNILISETEKLISENNVIEAEDKLQSAKSLQFLDKDNKDIERLTNLIYEKKLNLEIEDIKKLLISKEDVTSDQLNKVSELIRTNINRDEITGDLTDFITTKWEEYSKSGKQNENIKSRLNDAIETLCLEGPVNSKVIDIRGKIVSDAVEEELAEQKSKVTISKNLTSADGNLELISYTSGDGYIKGTIKNNSDNNYGYVEVNINLYDKNGNQLGNTLDNINNLEPYKTWNFEAPVIEGNVSNYKIVSIDTM